jgi:hypothetical protein
MLRENVSMGVRSVGTSRPRYRCDISTMGYTGCLYRPLAKTSDQYFVAKIRTCIPGTPLPARVTFAGNSSIQCESHLPRRRASERRLTVVGVISRGMTPNQDNGNCRPHTRNDVHTEGQYQALSGHFSQGHSKLHFVVYRLTWLETRDCAALQACARDRQVRKYSCATVRVSPETTCPSYLRDTVTPRP